MDPAPDKPLAQFPALLPQPPTAEEEQALVERFLAGLKKRFERGTDPGVRARLLHAMQHPVNCPQCAAACHVYQGSGRDEQYRPGVRAGVLRRIYHKYVKGGGRLSTWFYGDVELDWTRLARLAQLAYQCNLCERCVQSCRGSDHALIAWELRAVFQGMGIAPVERATEDGRRVQQRIAAIDQATSQRTGIEVRTPWDVESADVLLLQPVSSATDWPENVGATALLLSAAGINWTMSSELAGAGTETSFDDTVERLKAARRLMSVAHGLQVKRILAGEYGSAYRELHAYVPRPGEAGAEVGRASVVTLIADIVRSGRLEFDPIRNDFPVTLHDPCGLVRHGIVEPPREVLRQLCPQFREMDPWAEQNYCCGAGGGLAQIEQTQDWRVHISGSKKMEQVREAFSECLDADTRKYLCAPCGDCKTQLCQLMDEHAPWEQHRIRVGGLAELVVNAMVRVRPGFLNWEHR